jgi:hypothetical protein
VKSIDNAFAFNEQPDLTLIRRTDLRSASDVAFVVNAHGDNPWLLLCCLYPAGMRNGKSGVPPVVLWQNPVPNAAIGTRSCFVKSTLMPP